MCPARSLGEGDGLAEGIDGVCPLGGENDCRARELNVTFVL